MHQQEPRFDRMPVRLPVDMDCDVLLHVTPGTEKTTAGNFEAANNSKKGASVSRRGLGSSGSLGVRSKRSDAPPSIRPVGNHRGSPRRAPVRRGWRCRACQKSETDAFKWYVRSDPTRA